MRCQGDRSGGSMGPARGPEGFLWEALPSVYVGVCVHTCVRAHASQTRTPLALTD